MSDSPLLISQRLTRVRVNSIYHLWYFVPVSFFSYFFSGVNESERDVVNGLFMVYWYCCVVIVFEFGSRMQDAMVLRINY